MIWCSNSYNPQNHLVNKRLLYKHQNITFMERILIISNSDLLVFLCISTRSCAVNVLIRGFHTWILGILIERYVVIFVLLLWSSQLTLQSEIYNNKLVILKLICQMYISLRLLNMHHWLVVHKRYYFHWNAIRHPVLVCAAQNCNPCIQYQCKKKVL